MKLQSFCKAKDTVNKTKRPPTDWERIFTYPKSDRGQISNIYKELKKVDSRKSNNPIKKCGSELNKEFSPEEYRQGTRQNSPVRSQEGALERAAVKRPKQLFN